MTTETPNWFTSSYSGNGGQCVEVATNLVVPCGVVPVRDSKALGGPSLNLPGSTWETFIDAVKVGCL
ncbi:DUF397 domain-containing protein [Streptomyces sp. NPDC091272]|uniref:DUF397 domain-containing protein n=1 Tax=Streptomyces sp. NPDC091272 TaxID=3365981 RepID=UPI0037FD6124